MFKNKQWLAVVLVAAWLLPACAGAGSSSTTAEISDPQESAATGANAPQAEVVSRPPAEVKAETAARAGNYPGWAAVSLTDVRTGETFTIDSFAGKVVIMEMMAVWCPFCDQQQAQIKQAIDRLGQDVVGLSVDVDPGESAGIVAAHANQLDLPWRFVLAGPELSSQLRAAYGPEVLTPPATPVIIIGPDGTAQLTPAGIKQADKLVELAGRLQP